MPNITTYITDEGTITDGTSNQQINFKTMNVAIHAVISNFGSNGDITFKLNAITNDSRTVQAGKSFMLNNEYITDIYLSNASGSDIAYGVMIIGG